MRHEDPYSIYCTRCEEFIGVSTQEAVEIIQAMALCEKCLKLIGE